MLCAIATPVWSQGARYKTNNFIIFAATPQLAQEIGQKAEFERERLSTEWLGYQLPQWQTPCPIKVFAGKRGAGGKTTFVMDNGTIAKWDMEVEGTRESILDSVLPHEITHTILATYFAPLGRPVPRWADEGAATWVEHDSEKQKHDRFLVDALQTGRGLPFATMFTLKEYPADIWPLYAQGYSVTSFLIAQKGQQTFVAFLEMGMKTNDWVAAVQTYYGYPRIGKLQLAWNDWVAEGGTSQKVAGFTAEARGFSVAHNGSGNIQLASNRRNVGQGYASNAGYGNVAPQYERTASNTGLGGGYGQQQAMPSGQSVDPPSMAGNDGSFYQKQLQMNAAMPDSSGTTTTTLPLLPSDLPSLGGNGPIQR